jgi:hypothetical protein
VMNVSTAKTAAMENPNEYIHNRQRQQHQRLC